MPILWTPEFGPNTSITPIGNVNTMRAVLVLCGVAVLVSLFLLTVLLVLVLSLLVSLLLLSESPESDSLDELLCCCRANP